MRVLFISSGNSGSLGVLVKNQGESLVNEGIEVDYFLIQGKGVLGYIRNIPKLRRVQKEGNYQIIHAHYSFSAFTASLAKRKPLVVSLMGSDAYVSGFFRKLTFIFYRFSWNSTIVKSKEMYDLLKLKNAHIIPNGVDINRFYLKDKNEARRILNLPIDKKIIVFIADPSRPEKNFMLAEQSVNVLKREDVVFIPVYNVPNTTIPDYMNAADVLLLTSKWEGSVNVVKEAMACNLPIVSTDVGDVKLNISGVDGCYIAQSNPDDISSKLSLALKFNTRTKGREKLISMGLDSTSVAKKIKKLYEALLK